MCLAHEQAILGFFGFFLSMKNDKSSFVVIWNLHEADDQTSWFILVFVPILNMISMPFHSQKHPIWSSYGHSICEDCFMSRK